MRMDMEKCGDRLDDDKKGELDNALMS